MVQVESVEPTVQSERPARNVWCVVVAYRPDTDRLAALCREVAASGARIVIVDNTEAPYLDPGDAPANTRIVALGENTGIAHAQNVGIELAMSEGAKAVVFFDQDSTLPPGFLSILTAGLHADVPEINAPVCIDDISGVELPSLRLNRYGMPSPVYVEGSHAPVDVDIVIASGTAASRAVFPIAGMLDESLFIDLVDTEWCLRCRRRGIPIRVLPAARMHHRIGSDPTRFGPFTVTMHGPARCYYQLRNCFHLFRKPHVPFLFAFRELASVLFNRILLLWVVDQRRPYLKAYARAIRDGLAGVGGAGIANRTR